MIQRFLQNAKEIHLHKEKKKEVLYEGIKRQLCFQEWNVPWCQDVYVSYEREAGSRKWAVLRWMRTHRRCEKSGCRIHQEKGCLLHQWTIVILQFPIHWKLRAILCFWERRHCTCGAGDNGCREDKSKRNPWGLWLGRKKGLNIKRGTNRIISSAISHNLKVFS